MSKWLDELESQVRNKPEHKENDADQSPETYDAENESEG